MLKVIKLYKISYKKINEQKLKSYKLYNLFTLFI